MLFLMVMLAANDLTQSKTYWEAGDNKKAEELLKKGEDSAKENWEKQYYLYDRSLTDFSATQESFPLTFPPVQAKADYRKVYALFLKMRDAYLIQENSLKNLEALRSAVRQGALLKKSAKDTEKSFCRLDKIKGAKVCAPIPFLPKILTLADQFRAEIAHNFTLMRTQFFSPMELLLQFLIGQERIELVLQDLQGLESGDYLKHLSKEMETYLPLLKNNDELLEKYQDVISKLSRGDLQGGEALLKDIIQSVKSQLNTFFEAQEITEALYGLFEGYQEAQLEENVSAWKILLLKQEEIFKLKGAVELLPKELIEFANKHLEKAVRTGDVSEFLFADFAIKSSLFYTIDMEKVPPRILLRLYISLMDTVVELGPQVTDKEAFLSILQMLISKLPLFDDAALREEVREFQAKTKRHSDGASCVASPWEAVYPFFDEGRDLLLRSKELNQEQMTKVLENWLSALEALDNPKPPTTCPGGGGGGSTEEGESKPSLGGEGIEQVLQNIVQMGENDKEFEPTKEEQKKEVLKPW